ncbi:hypothetical protein FDP41_005250 [Naegleria fowleri]|uniref:Uncharacterized protein n=1 Tax=Naegleria fowleri TaxID=5763 RepID=A0A6A5BDF0_NAEFO|nr:uncharacterized protein FDP41_005250 [Naegleria fowleri]KAF0975923.1 hypothetical protein FDP41_005250 [Naegleria fowleri]
MLQPKPNELGGETSQFFDSDQDDPFFSEQAKEKYRLNHSINTSENHDTMNIAIRMESVQWTIPDSESGAYLNTLETRLQQLKNGRTFGKSRFFGHSLNPSSTKKTEKRIVTSMDSTSMGQVNCKCIGFLGEEEEDQDKVEMVGGKPLLDNSEGGYLEDVLIEHYEGEEQEFEDLQLKEMEQAEWTIEYAVNESGEQGDTFVATKRFYDLTSGELMLDNKTTIEGEVQELRNKESDEEDDIYDALEGMELKDEDELDDEEGDFMEPEKSSSSCSQIFAKTKTSLQDEGDDWEADFPEEN